MISGEHVKRHGEDLEPFLAEHPLVIAGF